jgi:hypothetical protein
MVAMLLVRCLDCNRLCEWTPIEGEDTLPLFWCANCAEIKRLIAKMKDANVAM